MDETPLQEEKMPDPRLRRDDWVKWLELQRELEFALIQDC
jgi:hypothetical protein